jgi:hypothetical protein
VAHGALELDDLGACARLATDGLRVSDTFANLVTEIGELFLRVLGLVHVFVTSTTLDLRR